MITSEPSRRPIEILEVVPYDLTGGELAAAALEVPKPGLQSPVGAGPYAVPLEGFAIGRHQRVTAIECIQDEVLRVYRGPCERERRDLASVHPDLAHAAHSGFAGRVNCAFMPSDYEFVVRAVLDGGDRAPIARVRGRRAPIRSSHTPALQPLMITTIGRSGSTAMLRLLAAHSRITAYAEGEARVTGYWLEVFRELSEPASYLRQFAPDPAARLTRGWWLGSRKPFGLPEVASDVEEWLAAEAVEAVVSTCHARIDAAYVALARSRGRSNALYFAEKVQPSPYPELLWELSPRAREIVLCRDLRDVAASWKSWAARSVGDDGGTPSSAPGQVRMDGLAAAAKALSRRWLRRSDRVHLVRYEDLVLEPRQTIDRLLDYLGLEASAAELDAMIATVGSERDRRSHATTPDVRASIGRWRHDLSASEQSELTEMLGAELDAFGYER